MVSCCIFISKEKTKTLGKITKERSPGCYKQGAVRGVQNKRNGVRERTARKQMSGILFLFPWFFSNFPSIQTFPQPKEPTQERRDVSRRHRSRELLNFPPISPIRNGHGVFLLLNYSGLRVSYHCRLLFLRLRLGILGEPLKSLIEAVALCRNRRYHIPELVLDFGELKFLGELACGHGCYDFRLARWNRHAAVGE